jgi:hypothetical protein
MNNKYIWGPHDNHFKLYLFTFTYQGITYEQFIFINVKAGVRRKPFWPVLNCITEPSYSNKPWVSASYNNRCLKLNKD